LIGNTGSRGCGVLTATGGSGAMCCGSWNVGRGCAQALDARQKAIVSAEMEHL
jgi:hypothetical protein